MERDVLERQAALGEGLEDVGELDHLVPRQGLGEVRDEIIGILQSQGKSQESVWNASLCALFRRETGVRGEPRLRYERLDVPKAGCVGGDRQRPEEALGGAHPALQLDAEHAAKAAQNALRVLVVRVRRQAGVMDLRDRVLLRAPLRDRQADLVLTP